MQNKRRGKASRHCLEAAALGLEAASPLGLRPSLDREGTRRQEAKPKDQKAEEHGTWPMRAAWKGALTAGSLRGSLERTL